MTKFKAFFTAVFATLSSLFGALTIPILLLVAGNVIDYVTGVFAAPKRGETVSSDIGLAGIIKKVCMWLLVVVGAIVDSLIKYAADTAGMTFPFSFLVACIVAIWLVCNELLSILENIGDIGVPLPEFLVKIIRHIKHQAETEAEIGENVDEDSN